MPIAEKDRSAFPTLGFLIDGETFLERSRFSLAICRLASKRPTLHVPIAAASGVDLRRTIARAWLGRELPYLVRDPQVAVARLVGNL